MSDDLSTWRIQALPSGGYILTAPGCPLANHPPIKSCECAVVQAEWEMGFHMTVRERRRAVWLREPVTAGTD